MNYIHQWLSYTIMDYIVSIMDYYITWIYLFWTIISHSLFTHLSYLSLLVIDMEI